MALHFESVSLASLPANLLAAPGGGADHVARDAVARPPAQVSPALAAPLNALDGPLLAYLDRRRAARAAQAPARRRAGAARARRPRSRVACALPVAARGGGRARRRGAACRRAGLGPAAAARRRAVAGGSPAARRVAVRRRSCGGTRHPRLPRRAPGELVVSFLDVGQGDATLVQDGDGTSVLFDGGPPEARRAARAARAPACGGWTSSWPRTSRATTRAGCTPCSRGSRRGCCSRTATARATRTSARLLAEADARGIRRVARPRRPGAAVGGLVVRVLAPAAAAARRAAAEDPNPRGVAAVVSAGELRPAGCRRTPRAARSCPLRAAAASRR